MTANSAKDEAKARLVRTSLPLYPDTRNKGEDEMKPKKVFYQQKEKDQQAYKQSQMQQETAPLRLSLSDFAERKGLKSLYYTR